MFEGMDAANATSAFVFLRGGTVTKGVTQTRTLSYGIVLVPNMELTPVEVKCIFETQGIAQGSRSRIDELCYIRSSLLHRLYKSQCSTWEGVRRSREDMLNCFSDIYRGKGLQDSSDDDYLGTVCEFRKEVLNRIEKVPLLKNQVGILVFREKKLIGLELFDNPDSWKIIHDKALESHIIDLIPHQPEKKKSEIEDLTNHEVAAQLSSYIENVKKGCMREGKDKILMKGEGWSTHLLSNGKLVEYTSLNGDVIHVLSVVKNGI